MPMVDSLCCITDISCLDKSDDQKAGGLLGALWRPTQKIDSIQENELFFLTKQMTPNINLYKK